MRDLAATTTELFELADEPALQSRRDDVLSLAAALGSDDAFLWAKLNLFDVFGPDAVEVPKERKTVRVVWALEFARNVCVLLPLLITWFGIARATGAYGDLLAADPAAGELPFIQLWQQGFNGRAPSFSTIGWLDFFAIFLVIALTVAVGLYRRSLDFEVAEIESRVWGRLRQALTDASLHLARSALDTPARFNEELTLTVQSMQGVSKQVRGAAGRISDVLATLGENTSRIETALAAFSVENSRHSDSVGSLATTVAQLAEWNAHLARSASGLSGQAQEMLDQQRVTTERVAQGLEAQIASSSALTQYASSLASSAIGQTDAANRFLVGLDAERVAQEQLITSWTTTTQYFDQGTRQLSAVASQLQGAADGLDRTTSAIPDRLASAYTELQSTIVDLATRFTAMTTTFEAATQSLASAAGEIPAGTDRVLTQMDERLTAWQGQMAASTAGIAQSADRMADTARDLPSGVVTSVDQLRGAIGAFEAAVGEMRGASSDLQRLISQIQAAERS